MRIQFNTGRLYQPATHKYPGQVIRAIYENGRVIFLDLSRGVDGTFEVHPAFPLETETELKQMLMHRYDNNNYTYIDATTREQLCGWDDNKA